MNARIGSARQNHTRFRLKIVLVLALGVVLFTPHAARAVNAYVHFNNRLNPLYITNIKIKYVKFPSAVPQVVTVIPEQIKYEKYFFDTVRDVEFREVVGEKHFSPVFAVKLRLRTPGHWREVMLMPITEFEGVHQGAPWVYPVDSYRGYEDNAHALKKIEFLPPRN